VSQRGYGRLLLKALVVYTTHGSSSHRLIGLVALIESS